MPTVSDPTALTDATAIVTLHAQTAIQPVLSSGDVTALMTAAKRASTWVHNTAYVVGDVIMPTVRNGHRYRCIQAGTSAALAADQPEWPTWKASSITEGISDPVLTWIEDGPEYTSIYDVRLAIHSAWMLKAAKASLLYSTRQSGSGFEHQQIYEHAIQMAEKYAPVVVA